MRRAGICLLPVVVLTAIGSGAISGQSKDQEDKDQKPGIFSRVFPFSGHKSPDKQTRPALDEDIEVAVPQKHRLPTIMESAAEVQFREEAAFMRRQAVCDKLRDIALRSQDEALQRRADQLEQRAWELYQKRTSRSGSEEAFGPLDDQDDMPAPGGEGMISSPNLPPLSSGITPTSGPAARKDLR